MTKLTKEVQEKGYQYFDWNCDSTDASGNNIPAKTLVENATSSSAQHINILMHDTDAKGYDCRGTAGYYQALPESWICVQGADDRFLCSASSCE